MSSESRAATAPDLVELFRRMALIRAFETRVGKLYRDAAIPGFIHTSVGQEAVAVGVCAGLEQGDYLVTSHRGHGHVLARGADPAAAMAELFGKATGLCGGKGGSMHIADGRLGILGANAIVGASVPIAAGAALSSKLLEQGRIAVAFFGEGAVNQGSFHESLNLAAIWELPVLLVCENNRYAEFTDSSVMSRRADVASLGQAYGIASAQTDGNKVEDVYKAAAAGISHCRDGAGPYLLEAMTYRWQGHYEGDPQAYKPPDETVAWMARDPVASARRKIEEERLATGRELDAILAWAEERIDACEQFARSSEFPALEEIWTDVYGD